MNKIMNVMPEFSNKLVCGSGPRLVLLYFWNFLLHFAWV